MGDQIIYLEKYIDSEWGGGGGWAEGSRSRAGHGLNSSRIRHAATPCSRPRPPPAHVSGVGSLATPAGTTSLPAELNRILNSIKDLDERSDGEMLGWAGRAVARTVLFTAAAIGGRLCVQPLVLLPPLLPYQSRVPPPAHAQTWRHRFRRMWRQR